MSVRKEVLVSPSKEKRGERDVEEGVELESGPGRFTDPALYLGRISDIWPHVLTREAADARDLYPATWLYEEVIRVRSGWPVRVENIRPSLCLGRCGRLLRQGFPDVTRFGFRALLESNQIVFGGT